MSPLNEDQRSDKEELVGKNMLMDNFMSDADADCMDGEAEVTYTHFRDTRGSIVITLKHQQSQDSGEGADYVDYTQKLREKHKVKAKVMLFLVLSLILFMAVFAFISIKNHNHHMGMNGGETLSLAGNLTGYENKTSTWASTIKHFKGYENKTSIVASTTSSNVTKT